MKYKVTLNGRTYEVEVEAGKAMLLDEYEAIAPSAPAAPAAAPVAAAPKAAPAPAAAPKAAAPAPVANGLKINSPMPGTILDVKVSVGASVKKGDILMILEAMKMENEIIAPEDGVVAQVNVQKGASVNSGDVLCVL